MGEDKRYYRYFPDFVIVRKTGEFYIVKVIAESERNDKTVEAKRKAVDRLQQMQSDKFKYHVVYDSTNAISATRIGPITDWKTRSEEVNHENPQSIYQSFLGIFGQL